MVAKPKKTKQSKKKSISAKIKSNKQQHKLRDDDLKTKKQRNPKAFAINATKSAERRFRRKQDLDEKRHHIPLIDRSPLEPPPVIVAVVGPSKVGKTTLIRSLVKYYTKHGLSQTIGPITLVAAKKRRLTLIECNNDIHCMVDIAKVADVVLLLVDASFGFEIESFEFLNLCQANGLPKIIGILTHLDQIKSKENMKKVKKTIKKRFWNEVYKGSKLFFPTGLMFSLYNKHDTQKIARHLSVIKFRPLTWQSNHFYILVDRVEDLTEPDKAKNQPETDRRVSMYGFIRGAAAKSGAFIHIPGCGDFRISNISQLPDPCPLSKSKNVRSIYAPFSGVGGIICDKDAVYIDLAGAQFSSKNPSSIKLTEEINIKEAPSMFENLKQSSLQIIKGDEYDKSQDTEQNDCEFLDTHNPLENINSDVTKDSVQIAFKDRQMKNIHWVVYNSSEYIEHTINHRLCSLHEKFLSSRNSINGEASDSDFDESGSFIDYEAIEKSTSKTAYDDHQADVLVSDTETDANNDDDDKEREKLMLLKMRKKSQFDQQYDTGGLNLNQEKTFYEQQKEQLLEQSNFNKDVFKDMDQNVRLQVEGYRPGLYVRIEFERLPHQLITNFHPDYPMIIGGLNAGEIGEGFVRVRMKKHRWYNRILKTKDPLIISMGWRRFQTVPIYHLMDDNMRHRALKYTPWHLHCLATFWGPLIPQNTGFVAFQETDVFTQKFRIAATGVVLDLDKSTNIVKKLKLIGTPMQVFTKTAFIQGMFNSELEVVNYEGAEIRTVSGIRGQIKKALKSPEGAYRATFEDKIIMSDIVFMKTWFTIDVPKFCIIAKTLLMPIEERDKWRGARTTGRIRFEEGIKATENVNIDSIYRPIERKQFNFKPFIIPRKLQKELPYNDKPKFLSKLNDNIEHISAIKSEDEKRNNETLAMMSVLNKERELKHKERRLIKKDLYIKQVEKKSKIRQRNK